tara:strand:+ start:304 stop:987 length:684 start_codon:yes stop_codon:yes gene_type:complete
MKEWWWKIGSLLLLVYVFSVGLVVEVPALVILNESIRNLFFHVPLWFAMTVLLINAMVYSIKYLLSQNINYDYKSKSLIEVAIVFGSMGFITGMLWAKSTWGGWLPPDVKIIGASITLIFYIAYFILRGSIDQEHKKARISAVYNIIACACMIAFIYVIPRLKGTDSLHPGNGGNPGFNTYDLDSSLRLVFYPAVLAWIGISLWFSDLRYRILKIERIVKFKVNENI